jgi:hypothetical protein
MKPYTLVCNAKKKKPHVLGRYSTEKAALRAKEHFQQRHDNELEIQKKYPGQGIEEFYRDLKIIGPGETE